MPASENILTVLPGATEHQRLVISIRASAVGGCERLKVCRPDAQEPEAQKLDVQEFEEQTFNNGALMSSAHPGPAAHLDSTSPDAERSIVLRQESFSQAVGWFTQSCVELTAEQWEAMRSALAVTANVATATRPGGRSVSQISRRTRGHQHRWSDETPAVVSFAAAEDQRSHDCAVPA